MKKRAIFLFERKSAFPVLYSGEVFEKIQNIVDIEPVSYCKQDLIDSPDSFLDVSFVFSSWGMALLSTEQIKKYLPNLECVFYGAGSVQKFVRPFLKAGVKVFSAWAANAVPVAEYTVAEIILANKGFYINSRFMKEKRVDDACALRNVYSGNYDQNVGLVGCGMIGSIVANMLKAYKLNVYVFDPFLSDERAKELSVTKVSLEELFKTCRVVSNHLANNDRTKNIMNYSHFSSMIPYSTFINTARGAQVVEADLARHLAERPDVVALLDVTYPEPAKFDNPFYTLENCIMTSHMAGSFSNELRRMAEYMVEEAKCYIEGTPYKYNVTEDMLEIMA